MEITEILEDFFFIERGFLNGNHFVYRSEKAVLIDTAYLTHFDKTKELIGKTGVKMEDVSLIINTHCHCDHIGGNRQIQDMTKCDIAMHRFGRYFINTKNDWATWWRYFSQEAEFFNCTVELNDGDILDIGPHRFQVIHTPGHSADGIVLYNEREKLLISSDALWERDIPVMTLNVEGSRAIFDMLQSLDRLKSLDVKLVLPGHGKAFSDFRGAIAAAEKKLHEYLGNRESNGHDLLKKIMIYTLMMKEKIREDEFFSYLMGTYWYRETVDIYFGGGYEEKFRSIIDSFLSRNIVILAGGYYSTTVKP